MVDICVSSVIQTYELRLNYKPYVCWTTFGGATLGANVLPNKLFLSFLFSDPDVAVQFVKDVGLIRRSMMCCKCGSQMYWCVDTNHEMVTHDCVGGSHLLLHALLPSQSGRVHGFSGEFNESFVLHVRRRSLIRTRSRARGGMWKHSSIPTTGWGTTYNTWPITCLRAGCRCGNVSQFTKSTGIIATMDWNAIPLHHRGRWSVIAVMSLRKSPSPLASLESIHHLQHVSLWRTYHHGLRSTFIRGAVRASWYGIAMWLHYTPQIIGSSRQRLPSELTLQAK